VDLVSIGEFARLSRLSPRALRLYDEMGLLAPAKVDTDSGYRWYRADQVDLARLIAALRQLGVPLARISTITDLDPAAAAANLRAFWAEVEADHHGRRALAEFLVNRLAGTAGPGPDVAVRALPARRLLTLQRHVTADELVLLGRDFIIHRMREAAVPRLEGVAGGPFCIYHGQVTADSDGPVEWCRPVPDEGAEALAARFPDLALRTEPAHEEAFVHLPSARVGDAEATLAAEALITWTTANGRQPAEGLRVVLLPGDDGPSCDFAIRLRATG
jgi:DNA-binding transcriptional MerR regulator